MANLRDIRRRIKSVKNTSQITKAMELVSAAKMKKAQNQALAGRQYADQLNRVLRNLKEGMDDAPHPLLQERDGQRELTLVISTDKGLCGGLNTNLLRKVRSSHHAEKDYTTVGKKLRLQALKADWNVLADWPVNDPVPFADAKPIAKFLTEKFLDGTYDRISVAFSNFESTLKQTPWLTQLLPIKADELAEDLDYEENTRAHRTEAPTALSASSDYRFEPNPKEVLNRLLPLYLNFQVYQMVVEARASEHSARMVAMKGATDNAKSMIKDLTLEYNKLRQAAITAELLEITTAMKAME